MALPFFIFYSVAIRKFFIAKLCGWFNMPFVGERLPAEYRNSSLDIQLLNNGELAEYIE